MIQLRAASRLIVAAADEAMARAFIKSVAHVTVGKLQYMAPDMIRFLLDGPQDFMTARKALNERYGKMDTTGVPWGSHGGKWKVGDTRLIVLSDATANGNRKESPFSITLLDTSFKESSDSMVRRSIGLPKNVPIK